MKLQKRRSKIVGIEHDSDRKLVRRGLGAPPRTRVVNGLVVFDLPEDSEPVKSEHVRELEAEERSSDSH
jgi:hypothetical protein